MDHKQLKGRPALPFETIAVAVTFSKNLGPLLSEAKQLADTFSAKLLLIHIGKKTAGKETLFLKMYQEVGIAEDVRLIWSDGDPIISLLNICKENMVDLLVLGALRRETVFHYYLGSVARGLCRRAKCSLLLLTEPRNDGRKFNKIVADCVDHQKTIPTLNTAFYFARRVGCREIHVVNEVDQAGLVMAMSDDSTTSERSAVQEQLFIEAENKIRETIANCEAREINAVKTVLLGRPGFMIRKYAEECGADLLVINSPDSRYGLMDRIFPHDMEYILKCMPCSMLIVHSRYTKDT